MEESVKSLDLRVYDVCLTNKLQHNTFEIWWKAVSWQSVKAGKLRNSRCGACCLYWNLHSYRLCSSMMSGRARWRPERGRLALPHGNGWDYLRVSPMWHCTARKPSSCCPSNLSPTIPWMPIIISTVGPACSLLAQHAQPSSQPSERSHDHCCLRLSWVLSNWITTLSFNS